MKDSLEKFLNQGCKRLITPRSAFVSHPAFKHLYVRIGPTYIGGKRIETVIVIANVEAKNPGNGSFTNLLEWIRTKYGWPVIVECVHETRFQEYLVRNGFIRILARGEPGDFFRG